MVHAQSESLVDVVSCCHTLTADEPRLAFAWPHTFSKHMIASLMKGIRRALDTNPGTSCDVATSEGCVVPDSTQAGSPRTFSTRHCKRSSTIQGFGCRLHSGYQFHEFLREPSFAQTSRQPNWTPYHHRYRIEKV